MAFLLGSMLVLSGCGSLGHHMARMLLVADKASQVTAFNFSIDVNRQTRKQYIVKSITSREDIMYVLKATKPQVVFQSILLQALEHLKLFGQMNMEDTCYLLECVQASDFVKALMYSSNSSIVHDKRSDLASVTEDLPLLFLLQQTESHLHRKVIVEQMNTKADEIGTVRTGVQLAYSVKVIVQPLATSSSTANEGQTQDTNR
jgi:sterol-4alpha-carboxylate 3-dehydrogenase (decarboxylating)